MSAVQIVKDIDLLKLLINLKADVNRTMVRTIHTETMHIYIYIILYIILLIIHKFN